MFHKAPEAFAQLQRAGFVVKRQSGSHAVLRYAEVSPTGLVVHPVDLPGGTLRSMLTPSGLTEEESRKL